MNDNSIPPNFFVDHDDLPEELKKQLGRGIPKGRFIPRILSLFDKKSVLTLNELLIGYYNEHGEIKKRAWMWSIVDRLKRKGVLAQTEGNKYIRVKGNAK